MKYLKFVSVTFYIIILISCASTNRNAGSLSDAMDKASDNNQGDRKVTAVKEPEQLEEEVDQNEGFIIFEEKREQGSSEISSTDGLSFGLQVGTGAMSSKSFYGMTSFSLVVEQFYKDKRTAFIELGGFYSPLKTTEITEFDPDQDEIVKALDGGIFSLYAGIKLRYYTTPEHTFLGNYFGFGFGVHSMFWTYKNALEIDEYDEYENYTGTETVSGDQLWGLDLNGSAALNVIQTDTFVLGIEFNPGIIIWGLETYEGFTNDVFAPFLYFKTNFNFMLK